MSIGLETIKTLAHSLEDIFKSLHSEELLIDAEVESLLLSAYDCLRLPLMEQITTGQFNSDQAMVMAEPVFAQIEARLGDFLRAAADLPTSVELGVDIALSIFEVDVAQGLERLSSIVTHPQDQEVAGELRAQAEVFAGIAELLELPGFGEIAQTTLAALEAHPDRALHIAQIALADFLLAQQAVIAGDRTTGGTPSIALVELATFQESLSTGTENEIAQTELAELTQSSAGGSSGGCVERAQSSAGATSLAFVEHAQASEIPDVFTLEEFGDFLLSPQTTPPDEIFPLPVTAIELASEELHPDLSGAVDESDRSQELFQLFLDTDLVEPTTVSPSDFVFTSPSAEEEFTTPSLEDVFGNFDLGVPVKRAGEAGGEKRAGGAEGEKIDSQLSIPELVQSIEQTFDSLPLTEESSTTDLVGQAVPATEKPASLVVYTPASQLAANPEQREAPAANTAPTPQRSVRVDLDRMERINNLVGELSINRNSLSLQNEQLQRKLQELLRRFAKFQEKGLQLRTLSDQMLVAPERRREQGRGGERERNSSFPPSPPCPPIPRGDHASSLKRGNPATGLAPETPLTPSSLPG